MDKTINDKLIEELKSRTPRGQKTADLLVRLTSLSREAAYRRLRGEIPFTLSEASSIAAKLPLSLDSIAGIDKKYNYIFHIKEFFGDDPFEHYYALQSKSLAASINVRNDPGAAVYFAGNMLPPHFYFKYSTLTRYGFFRFLNQARSGGDIRKFGQIAIPERVAALHKALYYEALQVKTCFVVAVDMIAALIGDVSYFAAMDMISPGEVRELVAQAHQMLDDMEHTTLRGTFPLTGQKIHFYVSNAYFDGNYCYLATSNVSTVFLYGINQLNCMDPAICRMQKEWIDSLIAHSTLITGSGKLVSARFFATQREALDKYACAL